jgi:hypothetical protein
LEFWVISEAHKKLCPYKKNNPYLHLHREVADETHPLEGDRYHTHENGTLEIYRTTEEDAGSYSCWVDNAMGKAVITANLDIRSTVILLLLSGFLIGVQLLLVSSDETMSFKFEHVVKFAHFSKALPCISSQRLLLVWQGVMFMDV